MNENFKMDQLLEMEIEKLAKIKECPRLYLANYFADLKHDVDIEMAKHQQTYQKEKEKKEKIMEIWLHMIEKIKSFEKLCFDNKLNKVTSDIKNIPNIDISGLSTKEVEEAVRNEENNIMQQLLQNRTIAFINVKYFLELSKRELTDFKLVILNDVFVSNKAFKFR